MVITTLHLQNGTLAVAALINIAMTFIVFSRGIKNKVNLYFGLLTFFNFLWAISLFFSKILSDDILAELFYRTSYFGAIWISVFLFYFTLYFPYRARHIKRIFNYFIYLLSFIISILIYTKIHIISFEKSADLSKWFINYYNPFYIIYSLFFFTMVIIAIYFLISKLTNLDSTLRYKIKILLVTIIIGLIFGSYFNLILCYFQNWNYIWFGPIFTAFMNIYVFKLIISSKEKHREI